MSSEERLSLHPHCPKKTEVFPDFQNCLNEAGCGVLSGDDAGSVAEKRGASEKFLSGGLVDMAEEVKGRLDAPHGFCQQRTAEVFIQYTRRWTVGKQKIRPMGFFFRKAMQPGAGGYRLKPDAFEGYGLVFEVPDSAGQQGNGGIGFEVKRQVVISGNKYFVARVLTGKPFKKIAKLSFVAVGAGIAEVNQEIGFRNGKLPVPAVGIGKGGDCLIPVGAAKHKAAKVWGMGDKGWRGRFYFRKKIF